MRRWLGTWCLLFAQLALCSWSLPVAADGPGPLLERVEPSAGPPGTLLRISGRRLPSDTRVLLGDVELPIELRTPSLITARVGPAVSSGNLRLETSAGALSGPRFSVLLAPAAPVIRRMLPARAGPGAAITLEGENFSPRLSQNEVRFGEQLAIVSAASPTQLQVLVPEGSGSVPVSLRVLEAGEARAPGTFEILPKLTLQAILPPRAAAGATLELQGTGFDPDPRSNRVQLSSKPLRVLEASKTRLRVQLPADAESGELRVAVLSSPKLSAALPFELLRAPSIRDFAPSAGPVGTELRVRGQGFGADPNAVHASLDGEPLAVVTVAPDALVLRVAPAAHSGKLSLRVDERGEASAASEFVVTAPLALSDVQPRGGPRGSQVILTGRGFSPRPSDQQVFFAGVPAQLTAASAEALTVEVPAAKTGPVLVQLAGQRAESRVPFVVTEPPRITQLSAERLPPSAELHVRGSGFGKSAALVRVTLAGLALRVLSVADDELVVELPSEPTTGELRVHVALQGAAVYPRAIRVTSEE